MIDKKAIARIFALSVRLRTECAALVRSEEYPRDSYVGGHLEDVADACDGLEKTIATHPALRDLPAVNPDPVPFDREDFRRHAALQLLGSRPGPRIAVQLANDLLHELESNPCPPLS